MNDTDVATILEGVRTGARGSPFDPRSVVFTAANDLRRVDVDGTAVIVKHLHPEGDWLSRATGGVGRAQLLWRSGVLQQLDPVVEHGVLGVVDFGDHEAIVMRDLSESLFPPSKKMTRKDVEAVLSRMAAFHTAGIALEPPPLCSIRQRSSWMDPSFHAHDRAHGNMSSTAHLIPGSLTFLAARAGEAGAALATFFDDLDTFEARVTDLTTEVTLLHGDLKPENLGYRDSRLVAVDWGELTGPGPAEFDVVRFVVGSCRMHTELEPVEIYDIYNRFSHRALDPGMLYLAMLWAVAHFGVTNFAVIQAMTDSRLKERAKASGRLWLDELRRLHADR